MKKVLGTLVCVLLVAFICMNFFAFMGARTISTEYRNGNIITQEIALTSIRYEYDHYNCDFMTRLMYWWALNVNIPLGL